MRTWRWIPGLAVALAAAPAATLPAVPAGYTIEVVAAGPDLSFLTGVAFDGDGVLHVSEADLLTGTGRVLRLEDRDGDGRAETIGELRSGFGLVTGLAFRAPREPRPAALPRAAASLSELERIRRGFHRRQVLELYVSHFDPGVAGAISRLADRDRDGRAEERTEVVTGLPSDGLNGNQQIAIGSDGRLYFGQGARTNSGVPGPVPPDGPLNAAVLRAGADGSGLGVFASGLRNPFDLAFLPDGSLWASENGPDASGPNPIANAPDELNEVVEGGDYGWPRHFGAPPEGSGTIGPLATFTPGSSTDGLAVVPTGTFCGLEGAVLAAQFGSFQDPAIGRKLLAIRLVGRRAVRVDEFATGFDRPLDLAFGPDGALYVADFSSPFFAPRSATVYRIRMTDADGDGVPDPCEN